MRKILLIGFSILFMSVAVYYGILFSIHKNDKNFLKIDSCYDSGGCWDTVDGVCRKEEINAQELCHRK